MFDLDDLATLELPALSGLVCTQNNRGVGKNWGGGGAKVRKIINVPLCLVLFCIMYYYETHNDLKRIINHYPINHYPIGD
jgi:hypothetical protein